jgi:ankyrin repeat protein
MNSDDKAQEKLRREALMNSDDKAQEKLRREALKNSDDKAQEKLRREALKNSDDKAQEKLRREALKKEISNGPDNAPAKPPGQENEDLDQIIANVQTQALKDALVELKKGNTTVLQQGNDQNYKYLSYTLQENNNHVAILDYLFKNGISPDTPNGYNSTILTEAVHSSNYKPDIVAFLLKKGADPNHKDAFNRTPMDWAIDNRNLDATKKLVEAGGDVNAPCSDINAMRPLHLAATQDAQDIIEYLLSQGADKTLTDNKGKKPYERTLNVNIQRLLQ